MIRPHIQARKLVSGRTRVVFLYSKKPEFAAAARALMIRGLMSFAESPIPGKYSYKAFYTDLAKFDAETYAKYAMLVRDFYASDIQENFNVLFPGLDHAGIKATIHNPSAYMEAYRPVVDALIAKYKDTTSPLEFYGSRHMAEGVTILLDCLRHKELKGGILADEQGMAKTLQAIIAAIEAGMKRVLVIGPKTAIASAWPEQLQRFSKDLLWRFGDYHAPGMFNVQFELMSWDSLRLMPGQAEIYEIEKAEFETGNLPENMIARLQDLRQSVVKPYAEKFDLLIADEAHRIKHADSQRSTAIRNIAEFVPDILLLTGTPVTKRPKDLLHPLKIIHHPLAKNPEIFLARYNPNKTEDKKKSRVAQRQRLEELHVLLRDCYIRREKSQTNLPPKIRYVEKVELKPGTLKEIETKWEAYCVENAEKMAKPTYPLDLVWNTKHREWVSLHKVENLCEWIDDLLEAGEKVAVYTCYTATFDAYMKKYGNRIAVGVDGRHSSKQRADAVKRFQNDPTCKLFIGNVFAAGESITITAAAYLGMNDLPYLPSEVLQVEDRICRGGQTRPCGIYFFLANHECDTKGFADFLRSKEVVQTVTNRRDDQGNIHDAEWRGKDGDDLELPGLNDGMSTGDDFDWEDAGMDPPPQKEVSRQQQARDFVERQRRMNAMREARASGSLFGAGATRNRQTAEAVLRNQLPAGLAGDQILVTDITAVQRFLTDAWDIEFAKSLIAWNLRGMLLAPKQRALAIAIIAKNRRFLPATGK